MGKHRKDSNSNRGVGIKESMTRQEMFLRTDTMREAVFKLLTDNGPMAVRDIAKTLKVPHDSARAYALYLVSIGAATKEKICADTIFTLTGAPYKPAVRKPFASREAILAAPKGRIIRMLDRRPQDIPKEEHLAARRRNQTPLWGSSMMMFDGY